MITKGERKSGHRENDRIYGTVCSINVIYIKALSIGRKILFFVLYLLYILCVHEIYNAIFFYYYFVI